MSQWTADTEPAWRVGTHQARNIYRDNQQVAVAVGPDTEAGSLAHRIAAAMNHTENLAECDRACTDCHRCMCACEDDDDARP